MLGSRVYYSLGRGGQAAGGGGAAEAVGAGAGVPVHGALQDGGARAPEAREGGAAEGAAGAATVRTAHTSLRLLQVVVVSLSFHGITTIIMRSCVFCVNNATDDLQKYIPPAQ